MEFILVPEHGSSVRESGTIPVANLPLDKHLDVDLDVEITMAIIFGLSVWMGV